MKYSKPETPIVSAAVAVIVPTTPPADVPSGQSSNDALSPSHPLALSPPADRGPSGRSLRAMRFDSHGHLCGHSRTAQPKTLAGWDTLLTDVVRRLRYSQCDKRKCTATVRPEMKRDG
jgi:hypothetical protein